MTETEIALQQAQAGVDASQALLGLGVSIEEEATTPELMAEQESPAYGDPIDHESTSTAASSAELRPDTNPVNSHDSNNTTASAVTDEDQPAATTAAATASRPKSGTMRRKVAKRTYGSPVFASKPPPAPVPVSTTTTETAASTKNDYYQYDEPVLSSTAPSLQLFREAAAFRPLTETAAIIESEMGVSSVSLEDLDMAAPMLLYSLSTSSSRNFNRKRKQRELQQQQDEQQAAAEDMLLFTPPTVSSTAPTVSAASVPSRVKKEVSSSPDKKKPVAAEKVKRTRSKPAISLKKQESISSAAAPKGRSNPKITRTAAAAKSKTKTKATKKKTNSKAAPPAKKVPTFPTKVPDKVKRTYHKKESSPASGKMARAMKPSEGMLIALPEINPAVKLPWPMDGQVFPTLHSNDVLSGRGNGVAIYPGNRQFREFIRSFKDEYVRAYRNEKGNVASDVIRTVLSLNPPGRFVEKAKSGNGYQLVDYSRALEKTSQALREGSAALRVMVFKDMYKSRVDVDKEKVRAKDNARAKDSMNSTERVKAVEDKDKDKIK